MTTSVDRVIDTASFRIPSLTYRILAGAARLVGLLVVLVGLPDAVLAFLDGQGLNLPIPIATVTVAGALISALATARYILRPSRLYGPLSIATSLVTIAYLFWIWEGATYLLRIPQVSATLSVGYADLILLALIVPTLGLFSAVVTTVEDLSSPSERLPFDYPG